MGGSGTVYIYPDCGGSSYYKRKGERIEKKECM